MLKDKERDLKKRCLRVRGKSLPAGYKKQVSKRDIEEEFERLSEEFVFKAVAYKVNNDIPVDMYKSYRALNQEQLYEEEFGKFVIKSRYDPFTGEKETKYSREVIIVNIRTRYSITLEYMFNLNSKVPIGEFEFTLNAIPEELKANNRLVRDLEEELWSSAKRIAKCNNNKHKNEFEDKWFKESKWYDKGTVNRNRGKLKSDLKRVSKNMDETEVDSIANTSKKDEYSKKEYKY